MIKNGLSYSSYEKTFVREALFSSSLRIDGRGPQDLRNVDISLSRTETSCSSEVHLGRTIVVAEVSAEIVEPYLDRPEEGFIHFNTYIINFMEGTSSSVSHVEISRALERIVRDSKSLDRDSLCIVSGEKVWDIRCDVKVLDSSGGNISDAAILATMSAMKAFRKPEITVLQIELVDNKKTRSTVHIHHSDDRDPLPLALHHTPLSVTLGIFKRPTPVVAGSADAKEIEIINPDDRFVLVVDPSLEEERVVDGVVTFSYNTYRELCAISKPGGLPLPVSSLMRAAQLAIQKVAILHEKLNNSINELEAQVLIDRETRKANLKQYSEAAQKQAEDNEMDTDRVYDQGLDVGLERDDPILDWSNLHQAVYIEKE